MITSLNKKKSQDSIFLEFPDFIRYLFLFYIVVVNIITPIYQVYINEVVYSNTYSRLFINVIYSILLYFPFILYNKKRFGLLHPFIFTSLIIFAKSLLKHHAQLVNKILESRPLFGSIYNEGLLGYNQDELSDYDLGVKIIFIVYLFFQYIGYFLTNPKPYIYLKDKNIDSPKTVKRLIYIILVVFISALLFFEIRGGLSNHFSSFGEGRQKSLNGMGIIFVFFSFSNLALMIWAAIKKEAFNSGWFWILVLFSMAINYLSYGARSMIFEAVISLLLVWLIHYKKIPYVAISVIAIFGFFVLTVLGSLRATTYSGDVDWSVLTEVNIGENKAKLDEELERRDVLNAPDVVIYARGIEDFGLFYGKTYLSAILFFVPRFIWDNKPHTISYYTGTMLFNSVGGMPPSTEMEAYWNFHVFGLIFIGFIHGVMYKWIVNFYQANHLQKTSIVLFIIALTKLEPNSLTLTHFVQRFFAVLIIYYIINLVTYTKVKPPKKYIIEN